MKLCNWVMAGAAVVGVLASGPVAAAVQDTLIGDAEQSKGPGPSVIVDTDIPFTGTIPGANEAAVTEWYEALVPGRTVVGHFRDGGGDLGTAKDCSSGCSTSPSQPFTFDAYVVKAATKFFAFVDDGDGTAHYDLPIKQGTSNITYLATVPVPAALPLLGTAVAGLALWRRRRRA
jgi:hypothetical protein